MVVCFSPGYLLSVTLLDLLKTVLVLYSFRCALYHSHVADINVCELDFLVGELKEWFVFD